VWWFSPHFCFLFLVLISFHSLVVGEIHRGEKMYTLVLPSVKVLRTSEKVIPVYNVGENTQVGVLN